MPLVFYIRISLRFWCYVSLSSCCHNLGKKLGSLEKGSVKLIHRVKLAHLFLQFTSNQFHFIISSLPMWFYQVNGSRQICFARCIMGTCERREIQCRIHGKCRQWSSCWSWNFPAADKQNKLNLIGRIRHVTHLRANSVHLDTWLSVKELFETHF